MNEHLLDPSHLFQNLALLIISLPTVSSVFPHVLTFFSFVDKSDMIFLILKYNKTLPRHKTLVDAQEGNKSTFSRC